MSDRSYHVELRLTGDGSQLRAEVVSTRGEVAGLGKQGEEAGSRGARGMREFGRGAKDADSQVGALGRTAATAVRSMIAFAGIRIGAELLGDMARQADAWRNINSRLELVTRTESRYAAAQSQTYVIAQRTYSALEATAELYGRMQRATDDLGRSQSQATRTTELINKTFQISGTEAGTANAAIIQLAQGLGAGALRGDEFNSVMEGAPRLAQALAESLGVTTGELRAMAEEGQLTAEVIIDALLSQGDAIDAEFERMAITNARAWIQVQNAALRSTGRIAERLGAVDLSAGMLQSLAAGVERLPAVADVWIDKASSLFGGLRQAMGDEFNLIASDVADESTSLVDRVLQEFAILPVSLATAVTVSLFELEKLRVSGVEQFDLLVNAGALAWNALSASASAFAGELKLVIGGAIDFVIQRYASIISRAASIADAVGMDDTAAELRGLSKALSDTANFEASIRAEVQANAAAYAAERGEIEAQRKAITQRAATSRQAADGMIADALAERQAALDKIAAVEQEIAAETEAGKARQRGTQTTDESTASAGRHSTALQNVTRDLRAYTDAIVAGYDALEDLRDGNAAMADQLSDLQSELAGATPAQIEYNRAIAEANRLYQQALQAGPPSPELEAVYQRRLQLAQQTYTTQTALDAQFANDGVLHADAYQQAWSGAIDSVASAFGDWVVDGMDSFSDFGDALVDITKQFVARIIAEFARAQLMQMFTGSGGSGWMSMAASAVGGGGASGGFGLGNAATWAQAGKGIWSGFSSALFGSGQVTQIGSMLGSSIYGPGMATSWAPTALGGAGLAAGGLAGAYYGYQRSGNVAGAIGYGALGLGATGAAMGMASGAGAMAGATGAFGALGASAAIPVIGWIAAIAAAVDMISGGKLFGTKYRPESTTSTLALGDDGGIASASMTEVRQRSLFRGRSWRTTDIDAGDEAAQAASALYDSVYGLMSASAQQLAVDVPPMLDAALRTVTEYDKKGKVKATQIFVDVLGRSWEEATAELATTRLSAEAIIATVDAALAQVVYNGLQKGAALQMDGGAGRDRGDAGDAVNAASAIMGEASQIAERWRDDAEQLMVGAQYLLAAATDMRAGNALLGEGVSLTAVTEFVDEMSQGAETILETYTRLSASASMLDQALDLSGTALDLTREEFVRFAADITDAAGGLDRASALWADYFQRFYTASELLDYQGVGANAAAQSEFSDIGQELSDFTGEGGAQAFRELFEQRLPTLSAEAVVEWLEAASALGVVIDLQAQQNAVLEEQAAAMAEYRAGVAELQDEIDAASMSDFALEMRDIGRWTADAIDALNASARAAGLQAASEEDLALVHQVAAQRAAAAIERLRSSAADLVAELYGSPLDQINEQIASMEAAQQSSIASVGEAAQDMYAAQLSALQGIKAWLDGQLLGDLSSLTPEQQLAEAQRQFEATLARAQSGDVDALQSITGQADALLRMGRDYYASSAQYTAIEQMVRGGLSGLVNAGPTGAATGGQNNVGGGGGVSPELQALYAERDAAMASAEAAQREALMAQLGGMIRELIQATGQPLAEVASSIGLNLTALAGDLGINLNDLSAQTASSLVDMARTLGVDVAELAANVGVSLGSLADRQSLLNQALDQTLADVPAEFRDQLAAPLDAIRAATTDADATAAVTAAETAIRGMPQGIRDLLAPYFEGIFPTAAVTELTQLSAMKVTAESQLTASLDANVLLQRIVDNLAGANTAAGIPAFASGGWVNGPTTLLAGEAGRELILPNPVSEFLSRVGIPINTGGDSRAVVAELRTIRESNERNHRELIQRVEQLERAQRDGSDRIARETQRQTDVIATGGR